MARKDVSDVDVLRVFNDIKDVGDRVDILVEKTGQPRRVVWKAIERTYNKGYLDYGVSLRSAWLTEEGKEMFSFPRF